MNKRERGSGGAPSPISPRSPAPDFDQSDWINEEKLGLDFPDIGNTKLTQSNADLRCIARKHKMCGETEEERQRVDLPENEVTDLRMNFALLCYSLDFEKLKPGYLEQLPAKLQKLLQFLGSQQWFVGDEITFVDFVAYDALDEHRVFVPDCPELQGNLGWFLQRFEVLEKVSTYMRSGCFMETPIFWHTAHWCNTKE